MSGGLELSRRFFFDVVRPEADRVLGPDGYAAALIGPGSEVLGLDDERSRDHDWGPRVLLVAEDEDAAAGAGAGAIAGALPESYEGHSLRFGAEVGGAVWVRPVDVVTVRRLFGAWVGFDPLDGVSTLDWLAAPSNGLLMLTAGEVFHDGPGRLTAARDALAWYPDEVWTWMLGCQWKRIGQEQPFVGRAGEAGDGLGSRVLTARLARDAVRLAFLVERRHAPYSKWLTRALDWLTCGDRLRASLSAAVEADGAHERQLQLAGAYALLGELTNDLALAPAVDVAPRQFHSRPYTIGPADDFAAALLDRVTDPDLRRLRPHGAADQLLDSTDAGWQVSRPLFAALLGP